MPCCLLHLRVTQAYLPCREAGRQEYWQAKRLQSHLTELTSPTTSTDSVPRVSFSWSGWACLACGFTGLFSPRGPVSVPGGSCSATRRFRWGGMCGNLLFFSLTLSWQHMICMGERFTITPLWADQKKQERSMIFTVKREVLRKTRDICGETDEKNGQGHKQRETEMGESGWGYWETMSLNQF